MDSHLSTDSDGPSFVILDPLSPDSMSMGPLRGFPQPVDPDSIMHHKWDSQSSLGIQEKIDCLLKENQELREALNQNNLAMKSQFDTLSMWQQEVSKIHQNHKQKFGETRDLVFKLRAENGILKKEVEKNGDESKNNLLSLLQNEQHNVRTLEAEKMALVNERDSLREECVMLRCKNSDLCVIIRKQAEDLDLVNNEIKNRKCVNGATSVEIVDTSFSGWQCVSDVSHLGSSFSKEQDMKLEDASITGKLLSEQRRKEEQYNKLVEHCNVLESTITKMKENNELVSKVCCSSTTKELQVEEYNKMVEHCKGLESTIAKMEGSNKSKECCSLTTKELCAKELEVESLKTSLKEKDEIIKFASNELSKLREKRDEEGLLKDEVELLRAQVEVYKTDYQEEREAREKLVNEKENMAEEIRRLKIHINGTDVRSSPTREAERTAETVEPQSSTEPSPAPLPDEGDDNPRAAFTCFKCEIGFEHLSQLQNHVEDCLQLA